VNNENKLHILQSIVTS